MQVLDIIMIGVALAMDACAITIANCTTYKCALNKKNIWFMPITFSIFQGIMPLIGFAVGYLIQDTINQFADVITACIFFFLSGKIIFDIIKDNIEEKIICPNTSCPVINTFPFIVLIIQALATSIDALAVGLTLVNVHFSILIACLLIAGITFLLVAVSLFLGRSLGKIFGKYAEWIGAIILLILALKSLIQALS